MKDGKTPRRKRQDINRANHKNPHADYLLVGAGQIAAELNQPTRRIFYWLETGRIACAKQMSGDANKRGLWTARRNALRREFNLD